MELKLMSEKTITIRPQMIRDAHDFFRIITTGNFAYFPVNVASVAAEKRFLRANVQQWRAGTAYNFSILFGDQVVGAVGIMPESGRCHNAEIGYFIDRNFHGRGFASQALRLAEEYALAHLPWIRRFQAFIVVENHASVKVVRKAGFAEEGVLRAYLKCVDHYFDAFVFGKILR